MGLLRRLRAATAFVIVGILVLSGCVSPNATQLSNDHQTDTPTPAAQITNVPTTTAIAPPTPTPDIKPPAKPASTIQTQINTTPTVLAKNAYKELVVYGKILINEEIPLGHNKKLWVSNQSYVTAAGEITFYCKNPDIGGYMHRNGLIDADGNYWISDVYFGEGYFESIVIYGDDGDKIVCLFDKKPYRELNVVNDEKMNYYLISTEISKSSAGKTSPNSTGNASFNDLPAGLYGGLVTLIDDSGRILDFD